MKLGFLWIWVLWLDSLMSSKILSSNWSFSHSWDIAEPLVYFHSLVSNKIEVYIAVFPVCGAPLMGFPFFIFAASIFSRFIRTKHNCDHCSSVKVVIKVHLRFTKTEGQKWCKIMQTLQSLLFSSGTGLKNWVFFSIKVLVFLLSKTWI